MAKSPTISVDISAVDQFSGTMARFRQELAKVNAPLTQLRSSMDQRAMSAPFAGIGSGLDALRSRAQSAAGGLSSLAPGMAALAGLGTVAGLARAAVDFGQFGTSLQNTARMAGISARDLYTLQGAARMTGLSADTASGLVTGLNRALHDAQFGNNNVAASYMSALHIPSDMQRALPRVADLVRDMAKTSPLAAQRFASIFNIPAEALPLLIKGGDAIAALQAEVARGSGNMEKAVAAANNYTEAQGRLENATIGLRNTLMTSLEPTFTPIVNGFSAWIAKQAETEAGAKSLAGAAEVLAGTALFRLLFGGAATGALLKGAVTGLGGAVMLPLALAGDMGPNSRPTTPEEMERVRKGLPMDGQPTLGGRLWNWMTGGGQNRTNPAAGLPVDKEGAARDSFTFWRSKGYTPAGAASMASMEMGESGGNVAARGDGGRSHGLYQHDPTRRAAILAATGVDLSTETDPNKQREAVYQEMARRLDAGAGRAHDRIRGTNDLQDGVTSGVQDFERSHDQAGDIAKRMRIARDIMRLYGATDGGKPEEPDLSRGGRLPALVQPTGPAASLTSSAGNNDGRTRVALDVTFDGAPDGMRHRMTTEGDGMEMGSVRVRRAMPMGGGAAP